MTPNPTTKKGRLIMDITTISATLSPDDQQAIRAAVETLHQKLPFLIDLTMDYRRAIAKLGDKTQGFVQKAWEIANEHEHMFAQAFLDEMRKDAQLLDALSPIERSIQTPAKKLNDTKMQVGAEAYAAARTVYLVTGSGRLKSPHPPNPLQPPRLTSKACLTGLRSRRSESRSRLICL